MQEIINNNKENSAKRKSITIQELKIDRYYNFQSKIYDATRWSFLFGRKEIVKTLPFGNNDHFTLAEIGSGTGYNLQKVADSFPNAALTGLDVSKSMVIKSRKKLAQAGVDVKILHQPFKIEEQNFETPPDVILINYALSMMNPQWKDILRQAREELAPGGYIAVADFHDSRVIGFKNHMSGHHVRMDSHLLPELSRLFTPKTKKVKKAYAGLWEYFVFLGRK